MAQVIIIEDNHTLCDLLTINLKAFLGIDVIYRKNAQDAITLLQILPAIDLIITKDHIGKENTLELITDYIYQEKLDVSVIVLGNNNTQFDLAAIENPLTNWELAIKYTAKILGINEEVLSKRPMPEYAPVSTRLFLYLNESCVDVYIRIKKSPSEFQYIKRIHRGDQFSQEMILKYIKQNLEVFYVPKEQHKHFVIFLSNILVQKLESKVFQNEGLIDALSDAYQFVSQEILQNGLSSETIQLSDAIIENIIDHSKSIPQINEFLSRILNSHSGTLYKDMHLISVISFEILKALKLDDDYHLRLMAYAAFFHDMALAENEELTLINTFSKLDAAMLSKEKKDLVLKHAFEASIYLQSNPEIPDETVQIIKNHHGPSNGIGFSENLEELPTTDLTFALAREFVDILNSYQQQKFESKPIIKVLLEKYQAKKIQAILTSLEKQIKQKRKSI